MAGVKRDCFAYNKRKGDCKALRYPYCKVSECKFYKKDEELCEGCLNEKRGLNSMSCIDARTK